MNPLWLLLIVPGTAILGYAIACIMWMADDRDERTIRLLCRQYDELRNAIALRDPVSLASVYDRHEVERAELVE